MKYYLKENFRFLYHDGQLYDETGREVYRFENVTLFLPQIDLYKEGYKIGHIKKNFTFFLKEYDVYYQDRLFCTINQRFTFFNSRMDIGQLGWRIEGDFFSWHYKIYDENDVLIATADQELFRLTQRFYIDILDENREDLIVLLILAINQYDREVAASASASSSGSHNN